MTGNRIQATAQSAGFTASLSISTRGNRQSVVIRSPGSEISEVAISLARVGTLTAPQQAGGHLLKRRAI